MNEFRIVYAKAGTGRVFRDGLEIGMVRDISVKTQGGHPVHEVTLVFDSTKVTIEHDSACMEKDRA